MPSRAFAPPAHCLLTQRFWGLCFGSTVCAEANKIPGFVGQFFKKLTNKSRNVFGFGTNCVPETVPGIVELAGSPPDSWYQFFTWRIFCGHQPDGLGDCFCGQVRAEAKKKPGCVGHKWPKGPFLANKSRIFFGFSTNLPAKAVPPIIVLSNHRLIRLCGFPRIGCIFNGGEGGHKNRQKGLFFQANLAWTSTQMFVLQEEG